MTEDDLRAAQEFLHEKIPLTSAMGVLVLRDAVHGFAIEAPLELNHNHLQTAFGGSINSVATLAGYSLLWLELRETAHVIVAASSIRFLRPVRKSIRAVCEQPAQKDWQDFRDTLRGKGKARLTLTVNVDEEGKRAAKFEGTFFALRDS